MNSIVKRQHYVWRYYLKPWAADDQIYCLRNQSKIFKTDLMNVGQERYFYEIDYLTIEDLRILDLLIVEKASKDLKPILREWIEIFLIAQKSEKVAESLGLKDGDLKEFINENRKSVHEFLHGKIEHDAISFLDELRCGAANFWKSDSLRAEFLHFVCVQYLRTNNMKRRMVQSAGHLKFINIERLWPVMSHLFATNISYGLSGQQYDLTILLNDSEKPMLTGDQPVINILADYVNKSGDPTEVALYYPISQRIGVLIENRSELAKSSTRKIGSSEVEKFNELIVKASSEQVYSDDVECLKNFAKSK